VFVNLHSLDLINISTIINPTRPQPSVDSSASEIEDISGPVTVFVPRESRGLTVYIARPHELINMSRRFVLVFEQMIVNQRQSQPCHNASPSQIGV
jgi:hypothetical protein